MDKNGKMGIQCTYCDRLALQDTDPPVCSDHKDLEKTAAEMHTLKEVSQDGTIWKGGLGEI